MVTKTKTGQKKGRGKVAKLKLSKETVKDLTGDQKNQIKGGLRKQTPSEPCSSGCITRDDGCE